MTKKCVLCGKIIENIYDENNPWPLADEGVCCSECNDSVVAARIARVTGENPEELAETLRLARKKGMEFIAEQKMKKNPQ